MVADFRSSYQVGSISMAEKFQLSDVGLLSLTVTAVPAMEVVEFSRCVQEVSPVDGSTNWCTMV